MMSVGYDYLDLEPTITWVQDIHVYIVLRQLQGFKITCEMSDLWVKGNERTFQKWVNVCAYMGICEILQLVVKKKPEPSILLI